MKDFYEDVRKKVKEGSIRTRQIYYSLSLERLFQIKIRTSLTSKTLCIQDSHYLVHILYCILQKYYKSIEAPPSPPSNRLNIPPTVISIKNAHLVTTPVTGFMNFYKVPSIFTFPIFKTDFRRRWQPLYARVLNYSASVLFWETTQECVFKWSISRFCRNL